MFILYQDEVGSCRICRHQMKPHRGSLNSVLLLAGSRIPKIHCPANLGSVLLGLGSRSITFLFCPIFLYILLNRIAFEEVRSFLFMTIPIFASISTSWIFWGANKT